MRKVAWILSDIGALVIGGLIGALLFVMSPVIGVLVGAAAGGVIGKAFNSDMVDQKFVDEVASEFRSVIGDAGVPISQLLP